MRIKPQRVFAVSAGTVNPLGNNVEDSWKALMENRSGIGPITTFDTSDMGIKIAGEVKDFRPEDFLSKREIDRSDRASMFSVAAAEEALKGIHLPEEVRKRTAVIIGGNAVGNLTVAEAFLQVEFNRTRFVTPHLAMRAMPNAHVSVVSRRFGLYGGGFAPASACATGNHSIGQAALLIASGQRDAVLAGGAEHISGTTQMKWGEGRKEITYKPMIASFDNLGALTKNSERKEKASRPFDRDRSGFVPAEGAAVVLLASEELVVRLNLPVFAEILGYGMSIDESDNATDPSGEGAARSMQDALDNAEIEAAEVDYINAHSTSTPKGDAAEAWGIKYVFGKAAYQIPVSSTKGATGHTLGCAGALESIFCFKALETGFVPATHNWENPDTECDLDFVPDGPKQVNPNLVMKNAFGFGPTNATLIFKKV